LEKDEANFKNSKLDWNSQEKGSNFRINGLVTFKNDRIENSINDFVKYWTNKFFTLHKNEESINSQLITAFGLENEINHNVHIGQITILKEVLSSRKIKKKKGKSTVSDKWNNEWSLINSQISDKGYLGAKLPFDNFEIISQFLSYSVGVKMGRYSLDKEGLILANQGETLQDYLSKVGKIESEVTFLPDDEAIIPILEDKWFDDDIVGRFYDFLKVSFSADTFTENLQYLEEQIAKDVRKWFIRDFYPDHIKRYKNRPIYWMFSSPKGHFNVLIYMHRYTPDMVSTILHDYLKPFISKLEAHLSNLDNQLMTAGLSSAERKKLEKEQSKTRDAIDDCMLYERETLLDIAQRRIEIDLDDGVLVNYNKFGKAVKKVAGLNDAKAKKKVRGFDWIDTSLILD